MRPVLTNRNLFLSISLFFLTSNLVSQAPVSFREVAAIYGVAGEGLSYGHSSALMDFNNDDLLDIGFTVKTARNFLFINRGNGHFDEIATAAGLNKRTDQRIRGMSVADYDNDGDLDVYLTAGRASQFYRNNGDLTFTDVTKAAGVEDFGNGLIASWGDYNRDGFIDLYVSNWDDSRHALFKNKGDGTFKNVTQEAGLGNDANNHVGLWLDFDNDGDLDMFVSRAFYKLFRLWRNNGDGTFTNIAGRAGLECDVFGQGSTTADYDNDGFLDIYVASCYERNILFHNNGDGTFTNIAGQAGVDGSGRSVDCVSGDFNNDGWMDIYVGNYGWNPGDPDYGGNPEGYNRLYWNNGNETFTNDPGITADRSRTIGSSIGDLNNDGFDDLYTVNSSTLNKLYENKGNSNNWLQIQLQGVKSSRDAIGTRIELEINGKKRIKEISGASGYCSHSSLIQTFGLGSANNVDRITIKWISGTVDELNNITVNQRLKLKEGQVWSSVDSLFFIDVNSAVLTPNEAKISWQTNKTARGFVRYGLTEDLLNTTDSTIVPGFLSAITLENLTADTTYYFLVSAMDTTGDGIESEMMSFVTTLIPVLAENIAAQALLTASSENEKWKQTVDKAVDGFVDGYPGDYTKEWVATTDPVGTWFNLEFEDGRVIDKIILHDRINFSDQILEMQLTFDSGDRIMTGPLPNDGAPLVIEFTPKTIKNIRLEVTKAQGSSVGLAEVEVWQAANSVNQPRLEIEQVNVTDIDSNSAVIHWRTSIECTGECYVNDDTLTTTLSNSHTVFVENLLPGTTYPFLIFVASTEGETAQSEVLSFTTMEASVPSDTIPADTTSTPQELFDITGNGLVTASSEKVRWGQTAVKAVDGIIDGYPGDYTKEWVSDEMPVGVWIRLSFPQPVFIGKIVGYDRPNLKDHIRAFRLHFSDGSHVEYGEMNNDGTSSIFEFEPRQTNWIELEVTAAAGENVGLAEFRVWGYIALGKQPGTESKILPQTFCISSNFPNPFNAMTQFEVHIPEPGWLQMAIFNIKGETVQEITNDLVAPGVQRFQWDGESDTAGVVSSGMYFLNATFHGQSGILQRYTDKLMYLK